MYLVHGVLLVFSSLQLGVLGRLVHEHLLHLAFACGNRQEEVVRGER